MPYRSPDPARTLQALREDDARWAKWVRERIGTIASEISRLDRLIGEASRRVPDGRRAPIGVIALMVEKESLQRELHALAWTAGSRYPVAVLPGTSDAEGSTTRPRASHLLGRSPFVSGLAVGLGLSAHLAFLAALVSLVL